MSTRDSDLLTLYVDDLKKEIARIDRIVFLSRGHSCAPIYVSPNASSVEEPNLRRITRFLSQSPQITWPKGDNVNMLPRSGECYLIWQRGVEEKVTPILTRSSLSGKGDAAIKQDWFLHAIALVRRRVLHHPEWFPGVQLRTFQTLLHYCARSANEEHSFRELREVSEELKNHYAAKPISLDVIITQMLILESLKKKRGKDGKRKAEKTKTQALAFLTTIP